MANNRAIVKERELKMVKKSLFVIALIGILATSTFAVEIPEAQQNGQLKWDDKWPYETEIIYHEPETDLCTMQIKLEVGMFIEVINCNQTIVLKQVSCSDMTHTQGKNKTFPCYLGCVEIKVRSNFEATLGLRLEKTSDIITESGYGWNKTPNWEAYFTPDPSADPVVKDDTFDVDDTGNENKVNVCVEAWDANIFLGSPGNKETVGSLTITVIPTATPPW
jgi:hypothetical protein